jgi:predicted nucleic-acid-binding Zn-ribbon protein
MNLEEFEKEFNTEEQCLNYLFKLRWENGYRCPRCENEKARQVRGGEIRMPKLWLSNISYCQNNFSRYAQATYIVVSCYLVHYLSKEWHKCLRVTKNFRTWQFIAQLGLVCTN